MYNTARLARTAAAKVASNTARALTQAAAATNSTKAWHRAYNAQQQAAAAWRAVQAA